MPAKTMTIRGYNRILPPAPRKSRISRDKARSLFLTTEVQLNNFFDLCKQSNTTQKKNSKQLTKDLETPLNEFIDKLIGQKEMTVENKQKLYDRLKTLIVLMLLQNRDSFNQKHIQEIEAILNNEKTNQFTSFGGRVSPEAYRRYLAAKLLM